MMDFSTANVPINIFNFLQIIDLCFPCYRYYNNITLCLFHFETLKQLPLVAIKRDLK